MDQKNNTASKEAEVARVQALAINMGKTVEEVKALLNRQSYGNNQGVR